MTGRSILLRIGCAITRRNGGLATSGIGRATRTRRSILFVVVVTSFMAILNQLFQRGMEIRWRSEELVHHDKDGLVPGYVGIEREPQVTDLFPQRFVVHSEQDANFVLAVRAARAFAGKGVRIHLFDQVIEFVLE